MILINTMRPKEKSLSKYFSFLPVIATMKQGLKMAGKEETYLYIGLFCYLIAWRIK